MLCFFKGQGQGPIAAEAIEEAIDKGTWVVLQNCHLAPSWMPKLEKIVEDFNPEIVNPSFRLWLTSMPSEDFPLSILQNGAKITNEPPRGMKANLAQTYQAIDGGWFESSSMPFEFKKIMFGLAFFHAIIQERRKFGALGWNIPYSFTNSDLRISSAQLYMTMEEIAQNKSKSHIPWSQLNYTAGELNYGGRVTDSNDRRTLMTILSNYYCQSILNNDYKFSDESNLYYAPLEGTLEQYLEYINDLPLIDDPSVFGLHSNANITCAIQETNIILSTILSLQSTDSAVGGMSREDIILVPFLHTHTLFFIFFVFVIHIHIFFEKKCDLCAKS